MEINRKKCRRSDSCLYTQVVDHAKPRAPRGFPALRQRNRGVHPGTDALTDQEICAQDAFPHRRSAQQRKESGSQEKQSKRKRPNAYKQHRVAQESRAFARRKRPHDAASSHRPRTSGSKRYRQIAALGSPRPALSSEQLLIERRSSFLHRIIRYHCLNRSLQDFSPPGFTNMSASPPDRL